jgi:hypothetical protein
VDIGVMDLPLDEVLYVQHSHVLPQLVDTDPDRLGQSLFGGSGGASAARETDATDGNSHSELDQQLDENDIWRVVESIGNLVD